MSELNQLSNGKYAYLSRLSVEELLDLLSVAPIPAASPEQEAYVDALKEAIIEKENENPTGFFPDPDQQWKQFVTYYLPYAEEAVFEPDPAESAAPEHSGQPYPEVPPKRACRFSRAWRTLLVAAVAVGCMFAIMVTAQATGFDVFGAMARWTEDVFSFKQASPNTGVTDTQNEGNPATGAKQSFTSLQEVLDTYEITQVHEPTKLPDGFVMDRCVVERFDDSHCVVIYGDYVNNHDCITVNIMSYEGEPAILAQKRNEQPETIEFDGITFFLLENDSSSIVAWYDDAYEYYVSGKLNRENLWETAISMIE